MIIIFKEYGRVKFYFFHNFFPSRAWFQMKTLSESELLPKIIEAYSRPTRIVRGKDATHDLEVQNFEYMAYVFAYLKQ